MAKNFLTAINLNKNELQNAVLQNLAIAPENPVAGQQYFDTTTNTVKTWSGSAWSEGGSSAATHVVGSVGTGGTVTDLPTSGVAVGDTYIVCTAGTYNGQASKIGDQFIANAVTPTWLYIPSGNDGDVYKFSALNPTLAASGGVCSWAVTHNLGNQYPTVQIYEVSTGEMVIADVVATSTTVCTININADGVTAGVYKAVVMG